MINRTTNLLYGFLGAFLMLCVLSVMGNTSLGGGNPYPLSSLPLRTDQEFKTLSAGSTASSTTLNFVSKSLMVTNEGAFPCRVTFDGTVPTATVGTLLNAGATYSNQNFVTKIVSVIRTGASDTIVRVETNR